MSGQLPTEPRLPPIGGADYTRLLHVRLRDLYVTMSNAINRNRRIEADAEPATGLWAKGQFVWNSDPSEQGSPGSKYVLLGWVCVADGEPGTWMPSRALTGN